MENNNQYLYIYESQCTTCQNGLILTSMNKELDPEEIKITCCILQLEFNHYKIAKGGEAF